MFFFFKQRTAYEMRISDWSSDVCSSDHVQICHCRVDHGMLLACARHVPPSAKPAEIGVQPRCPIFGIVEESEIFAPGQLVDLGNCIDCPNPCLAPVRRVELMAHARDMLAWMHRHRNARDPIHYAKAATNQRRVFFHAPAPGNRTSMIPQRLHPSSKLTKC